MARSQRAVVPLFRCGLSQALSAPQQANGALNAGLLVSAVEQQHAGPTGASEHVACYKAHQGSSGAWGFRTFATSNLAEQLGLRESEYVRGAADVLQQVQVLKLRQDLEKEAKDKDAVPRSKLFELMRTRNAARTENECEELTHALHKAGCVLAVGDVVYLRPREIVQVLKQALPGTLEHKERREADVEQLLALHKHHLDLEARASRLSNALLVGGFFVLVTQFTAFIWLTWWELSWDVMEPIAYVISLFYSIVAYGYFLVTRHYFDLEPFHQFWSRKIKDKKKDEQKEREYLALRARYPDLDLDTLLLERQQQAKQQS